MTPQRRAVERLSIKLGFTLVCIVLLFFFTPVLWRFLNPFIIALPFAAMIQPTVRFLEKKLHLRHSPAVLIPVLLLLLIMLTAVIWFLAYGVTRAGQLLENPGTLITGVMDTVQSALNRLLSPVEQSLQGTGSALSVSVDSAMEDITAWGTNVARDFVNMMLLTATGVPYALIYINFFFMGIYFIGKDYDRMLSFLPHRNKNLSRSDAARLTTSAISGAIGYLKVQVIYGLISAVVSTIYFAAFRNPYAFIIGLLAGILEFIPMVGHAVLYLPWALVELILGNFPGFIIPLAVHILLYIFRKLTEPKLMSHNIGLSPLLSVISMFIGIQAGGIGGLVLGPVVMTVVVSFLRANYLVSVKDDVRTLVSFMKRRWSDANQISPAEEAPAPADPEAPASPEAAAPDKAPPEETPPEEDPGPQP